MEQNHVVVLPDADMPMATQIISDSAFGCAGQRCLAVSVAITIGEAQQTFRDSIADAANKLKVGNGLGRRRPDGAGNHAAKTSTSDRSSALAKSKAQKFSSTDATPKSRATNLPSFVKPTILDDVPKTSDLADTEIFGPVLSLVHADNMDDARLPRTQRLRQPEASLFTSSVALLLPAASVTKPRPATSASTLE